VVTKSRSSCFIEQQDAKKRSTNRLIAAEPLTEPAEQGQ